jgi:short-subunit dehydrogenase
MDNHEVDRCAGMELRNRKLFVTGATSGIGRALARLGIERGAKVTVHGRNPQRIQESLASFAKVELPSVVGDLATAQGRASVEAAIRKENPDILVLNAGYNCRKAYAAQWSDEEITEMIAVNLTAPILCARTFLKLRSDGAMRRLAIILSTSCHHPRSQMSLYVACKMGLMGFGKVVQLEAEALGVRTTLFYPGRTNTEFRDTPHPEYISPESVAEAILGVLSLPSDLVPYEFTFRPPVDTTI